jgi:hypothetical protein
VKFRVSPYNVSAGVVAVGALAGRGLRNSVPDAVLVSILCVVFAAIAVLGFLWWRRRSSVKALEKWARENGFVYHKVLKGSPFGLTVFPFGQSGTVTTHDFVGARYGSSAQVYSFVLRYAKGMRQQRRSVEYQVVALRMPRGLPTVQWIPLDTVSTATVMAGGQKIDFESAEFNANWRVMGDVPRHVHEIVHPRLMERMNAADALGRPFVIEKDVVFTWSARRQAQGEIVAGWGVLGSIHASVPPHVWEDRSFRVEYSSGG